ncbi:MAG: hypothetical protein JWM99_2394 [Verrucomicrobiales bacterium]|nr:hypothetical protein [Verrucomicrobiales bacterium]
MLARFEFALTFADLLFELFGNQVDGGIKIAFGIFRKKVGAGNRQANGTAELLIRSLQIVVLKGNARIDRPAIKVFEFVDARENMFLNRLRQRHIVCRKYQFHI